MSFGALEWMVLVASPFVGSFLGLVVIRLPEGEGVVLGRSYCPICNKTLGVPDLVPIFSWLWLRGRCRHCSAPISFFYPLMELGAVFITLWVFWGVDGPAQIITVLLGWWLLVLALIDFRKFILPDTLTLPLVPLGLWAVYFLNPAEVSNSLIGSIAGFALMFGVGFLYKIIRGREGLGLGDVKLMAAAGAWVGWIGLSGVLGWAVGFSLLYLAVTLLLGKPLQSGTQIPFGTFLSLGFWLVWLYGPLLSV